jgi:iron complex outermembrane receptor protein
VAAFRYGGALQRDASYRVYAKAWRAHDFISGGGIGAAPGHDRAQAGFRTDWRAGNDGMTVQGGAVTGASDNRRLAVAQGVDVNGAHLLGRWTRALDAGAEMQVQAYFDRTEHDDRLLLDEKSDLFDIEVRHAFPVGRHRVQWGGGYRHARDETAPGLLFAFTPATRTLDWTNLFAEGYLRVREDLELTLGARLEENSYTGWEWLPNARVAWKPIPEQLFWAALSRAVRAPSRLDREVATPPQPPFIVVPGATFTSETADVAEAGWRGRLARTLTVSATVYVQEYDHLRSAELTNGGFPVVPGNLIEGSVSGLEAWAYWQASPSWRLSAGFTTLESRLRRDTGSTDPVGPGNLGNHPNEQLMLRSSSNIGERQELDVMVRRVGSMAPNRPNTVAVAAYTALDLRYAWNVRRDTQLALVIRNALDPVHREWGDSTTGSEIRRSAMVMLEWNP